MKISGIGFVYMITSPTGRIYVGSSEDVDIRWSSYFRCECKTQSKLYNSLKKYGSANHIFEIVWAGDINDMYKYETLIGWGFDVLEPENLNCKLPKLGEIWKVTSQETREKMKNSILGKKATEKTKLKLKEARKKFYDNGGVSALKGREVSEETREKIRQANKGRKRSPEELLNVQKAAKNRVYTKESKEKLSATFRKIVYQYSKDNIFIKEWISVVEASKCLNIAKSDIAACARDIYSKKYKTAGKFK